MPEVIINKLKQPVFQGDLLTTVYYVIVTFFTKLLTPGPLAFLCGTLKAGPGA